MRTPYINPIHQCHLKRSVPLCRSTIQVHNNKYQSTLLFKNYVHLNDYIICVKNEDNDDKFFLKDFYEFPVVTLNAIFIVKISPRILEKYVV